MISCELMSQLQNTVSRSIPRTYTQLLRLLGSKSVEVVVMPIEKKHLPLIVFLLLIRCIFRFRLVSYNHPSLRSNGSVTTRLDTTLSRLLFRCYDFVVFYTESSREWALRHRLTTRNKSAFANNTLDTDSIWQGYSFEVNCDTPKTILFIGRLVADKRLDLLFFYFDQLRRRIPTLQLRIIGDGPEAATVRRACRANPNVEWLGAIVDEDAIATHMKNAHAVFIPGHSGLSIVHAFSYGKAVHHLESRSCLSCARELTIWRTIRTV